MCLAIPALIREKDPEGRMATADVMGVSRKVNIDLLRADPPQVGDWVLIHVGFAMSKISAEQAEEQIRILEMLGEAADAREEAEGYSFAAEGRP